MDLGGGLGDWAEALGARIGVDGAAAEELLRGDLSECEREETAFEEYTTRQRLRLALRVNVDQIDDEQRLHELHQQARRRDAPPARAR